MPDPMDDDRDPVPLPDTWVHMARTSYHAPDDTPREEIWKGVEARLFGETAVDRRPHRPRIGGRWMGIAAAASIALLAGVGVGRWSMTRALPAPGPSLSLPVPAVGSTGVPNAAGRVAAARHLSDTEALLVFVQADAREGRTDRQVGAWGRGLLTRTRLLLDSPTTRDPSLRRLLEDLEVILAQVALLADPGVDADRVREELALIASGVEEGGLRGRIRSALPSVGGGFAQSDD